MLSIKTIYAPQPQPQSQTQAKPVPTFFPLDRLCLRSNEIGVRPLGSMTHHAVYLQPPPLPCHPLTLARRRGIEDEINDRKGIIVDGLDDVFYAQAEHNWIIKAEGGPSIQIETGRHGVPILCSEWEFWAVLRRADLERLAYFHDRSLQTFKEYAPCYVLPGHEGPKVD